MGELNTAQRHENRGLTYLEFRPDLDFETIRGQAGVPALVTRGIFRGFTLPVYAADNQELFISLCVPGRWDGESDITVEVVCWLSQANDAKNFQLRLEWEHFTPGVDAVPATSANVDVETATGAGAPQFKSYKVLFTLPYGDLLADDILQMRLYRIAASINECAGNIVINHQGLIFRRDKLGVIVP